MRKKLTNEDVINKFKLIVNGDDYSLVEYVNSNTKVKIVCKKHGIFEQFVFNYIKGYCCPKCSITDKIERFNKQGNLIHNNKYDYSLSEFSSVNEKVKIICPIHGEFEQTPEKHIDRKQGCPKCGGINSGDKTRKTTEDFNKQGNLTHNNKFDYSLTNYFNDYTKIKIICPEHGVFEQRPSCHLQGHGCPICKESKGEKQITKFLIEKEIKFTNQHRFPDCKHIKPLPFDFYLPDLNMCVEYDGAQHFNPISVWGGEEKLIEIQKRDLLKTKYCEDNNIPLIRISYKDNIIVELSKKLTNTINKTKLHNIYN